MQNRHLPELLAPAGTRDALDAAIRGGADAVYFGGSRFNARMNADNFDDAAMEDAIRTCAFWGVKSNITLNTLPTEREFADVLFYAEKLCKWGADAIICADLGTAAFVHKYFPEIELHASTQCAGHNTDAARLFAEIGFSRMVAAREVSFADLRTICRESPIETELFIHGALCVSQSGGCLFSSLVGGRSGNRGDCAQPCRLPYSMQCAGCKQTNAQKGGSGRPTSARQKPAESPDAYPLSLKDYCLAGHVTELLTLGAASFKIEGRMKSPQYVEGVVRIWRRLLDEGRNATDAEMQMLSDLFSRGGAFTDDYFRATTGGSMKGIRTEEDKAATAKAEKAVNAGKPTPRKLPCHIRCAAEHGTPVTLTLMVRGESVTVSGPVPENAENRATTAEDIRASVTKLGNTPFVATDTDICVADGLSVSLSALNALRRAGAERLAQALRARPIREITHPHVDIAAVTGERRTPFSGAYAYTKQASFLHPTQITGAARAYYDIRYLPLETFAAQPETAVQSGANGVILPPVVFDHEREAVISMLKTAQAHGICHVTVSNMGHMGLLRGFDFLLHGDLRLNVWTAHTATVLAACTPLCDLLLSPELSLPQMRDLQSPLPRGAVTYGRLPMMTLQRCIIREQTGYAKTVRTAENTCRYCDKHPVSYLCDRKNMKFPVTRSAFHRNIIWNTAPVYMADKQTALAQAKLAFVHHLYTVEGAAEVDRVIRAHQEGTATGIDGAFRRM